MDARLTPFRIDIPQRALDDLRTRLQHTRLPQPLPGDGWDTGVPVARLQHLVGRWADHDWRTTEDRLNRLPQVTTRIDGQTILAQSGARPVDVVLRQSAGHGGR